MENRNKIKKRSLRRKYIITFWIILLIFIAAGYGYIVFTWTPQKSKLEKMSEEVIRKSAAYQLNKNPDELTNEDFAKITTLTLMKQRDASGREYWPPKVELTDIKLLAKFTNLESLYLNNIASPEPEIPKWMVIMAKLKLVNLHEKYRKNYFKACFIDLTPLENLSKLKEISLYGSLINDFRPLAKIENLREVHVDLYQLDILIMRKKLEDIIFPPYPYGDTGGVRYTIIPERILLGGIKEFEIVGANLNPSNQNKNSDNVQEDSNEPLPKIYCQISGEWLPPMQRTEMNLLKQIDRALGNN